MKDALRSLKRLAKYVLSRGLSSIITISIFGLFARQLPYHDLENALSFSLVFGFFGSLSRSLPSFAARIRSHHSLEERFVAITVGYRCVLQANMVLAPLVGLIAFAITGSLLISILASSILAISSFDVDLFRAASGQEMIFPRLFLLGSICGLIYFSLQTNPNQRDAFITTMLQWLPVAVCSARQLISIGLREISRARVTTNHFLSSLLIVSFDGIILNLPMMPFIVTSADIRIELAVFLRNFISSLFVLPFLLFVTNRMSLSADRRFQHERWIFFASIFGSSVVAFSFYVLYFGIISGRALSSSSFLNIIPLAFGFSAYYSNARFLQSERKLGALLAVSMCIILIGEAATLYLADLGTTEIVFLQAISFLLMTAVIAAISSLGNRHGSEE